MTYLVVIEVGQGSVGAYVPDLPGCVAVGADRDEVMSLIHDAIALHVDALREQGLPVPVPHSAGELVDVPA